MSSTKNRIQARARVQITLEVVVPDTWGADCPMDQIWRQAEESALGIIAKGIPRDLLQMVGAPRVVAVLSEKERP